MKKLLGFSLLLVLVLVLAPLPSLAEVEVTNGEGLYPFTRRADIQPVYGEMVELRFVDDPIGTGTKGRFGWLSWSGSTSTEDLVASLAPPGNAPATYYNPGTPENGWTPNYGDNHLDVGDWGQGMPGNCNANQVRELLDWHIANKTAVVIPLYDAVQMPGALAVYRVASFAAFEIQSYDLTGQDPVMVGKFLRWVTNGNWH